MSLANYIEIAEDTKSMWELKEKPIFHHLIGLICAQEVRFSQGRKIRQSLYKISPNSIITPDIIRKLTIEQLILIGLTETRARTIKSLCDCNTIDEYNNVSGVGPWTIKGLKILCNIDKSIVLFEDKWIRQRLGELFDKKILSISETKQLFNQWEGHESTMSYFFWRIKPSGIIKLKNGRSLSSEDFV